MKQTLLKVESLGKVYSPGQTVWTGVTFQLEKGEFLYILGGSGAGKSSLLRSIASFEEPSEGQVECLGVNLQHATPSEIERIRKKISFIPQNLGLISDLTLRDHVELSRLALKQDEAQEDGQIKHFLKVMGLEKHWHTNVGLLSGGEKQRVAILRALSKKAELIIADEPTGAQDFEMTWKLMDLFIRCQLAGSTILFATHDLEMVRRLRKRVGILKDGSLRVEDARTPAPGGAVK